MELFNILSAFGLSASAGLNAYLPLLVIALLAKFTNLVQLNSPWDALTSWWVIGLLFVLSIIEFFADKIPAVNHVNDLIQTAIRPLSGAILFASSAKIISDVHPVLALALGLFVAGSVHTIKAVAIRPAVTATTAGAGNVPVSILEDVISTVVSFLSAALPVVFAVLVLIFTAWLIWRFVIRRKRSLSA